MMRNQPADRPEDPDDHARPAPADPHGGDSDGPSTTAAAASSVARPTAARRDTDPAPDPAPGAGTNTGSGSDSGTGTGTGTGTARHTARTPRHRLADTLPLLLTVAAGATDAVAYLGLGGVFTANMTGNLVLLGIAGSHGVDLHVARAAAATVAFTAGLVLAFLITRDLPAGAVWPRRITAALAVSLGCQLAFLAGWAAVDGRPGGVADVGLVSLSALAMGVQTACARRVALGGITTTFVTGTLTSV
ncbi:YoaK family protein, partial [Streptomyces sp. NPDC057638]|uniref:YoaK family protein n=1 Tax=Streptomyces sp. NPDC057638 TaxID=3346190 RepID=UPI0036A8949D